jgi:hypothetical protein
VPEDDEKVAIAPAWLNYKQAETYANLSRTTLWQLLDEAIFAANGWPPDLSDEELLQNLLALNLERAREGDRCQASS